MVVVTNPGCNHLQAHAPHRALSPGRTHLQAHAPHQKLSRDAGCQSSKRPSLTRSPKPTP
eukprot:3052422-Prymnesium_polylepis.2